MTRLDEWTEIIDIVNVTTAFSDFDGDAEKWRQSYFELLSWKNTWGIPLQMDVMSTHDHEPYVFITLPKKKNMYTNMESTLKQLGYGNIQAWESKARIFYPMWHDVMENDFEQDINYYFVD